MSFHDHFSGHAQLYASARPTYPASLYEFLSQECSGKEMAIDCASGNGQAAIALCEHFQLVLMSDASSSQLQQLELKEDLHGKVLSTVALAESMPVREESADLVTVAQALHWFNFDNFCEELDRMLKPGGIFAVWSYGIHSIAPGIDALINRFYEDIIGEYWSPERREVEDGYAGYCFPFQEVATPCFKLSKSWSIDQVRAYLNSWSAVQKYQRVNGKNPVELIDDELRSLWGSTETREISWPLTFIVRRKM